MKMNMPPRNCAEYVMLCLFVCFPPRAQANNLISTSGLKECEDNLIWNVLFIRIYHRTYASTAVLEGYPIEMTQAVR